jgi:uncharacterized oligopeptide transporter (OPT) family protein
MVPWSLAQESIDLLPVFGPRILRVLHTLSTLSNLFNFGVLTGLTIISALPADLIVAPTLTMLVATSKSRLREELRG